MHNAPTKKNRRHFIASAMACSVMPFAFHSHAQSQAKAHILVLGDSLSAEYGLARGQGWVHLLEQRLAQEKIDAQVTNASVSGDTTSGGRSRLPALLQKHRPTVVIIELGGNDALRGLPLQGTRDNLGAMIRSAQQASAQVLLLGMQMPPNYGKKYAQDFAQMYGQVAQTHQAQLLPFFLKDVADAANPTALFQADRIHPTAQAQPIMLENVWPLLRPMLK